MVNRVNSENIIYVIQAYNRPKLFAPSLLSLRNQIISKNRKIFLVLDGPKNEDDRKKIEINKIIFNTFFENYPHATIIQNQINVGAELMFVQTWNLMFEKYKVENFALFEDDLYFEKSYIDNVENLLNVVYDDDDIYSVNGFTRQTIFSSNDELEKNKGYVVAQHNLIGSIYKIKCWSLIKPIFDDFVKIKSSSLSDDITCMELNKKYGLNMPHLAYDKIIDHMFAKHKKLRVSTYNRYLYHLGIFGTSCVKVHTGDIVEPLKNFIRFNWNYLSTDSSFITEFTINKNDPTFIEQMSKEL
jgi:hypothetical protein